MKRRWVSPVTSIVISNRSVGSSGGDAVGPFDESDACGIEVFVGAEIQELVVVFEPVGIEVVNGHAAARVFVQQDERRAGHAAGGTPSAVATACTSRVLPAPNGPIRPMTVPGGNTLARAAPKRSVSASSLAANVNMIRRLAEFLRSQLLAEGEGD